MPIVKFVKNSHQSKTALSKTIDYVTQEKKLLPKTVCVTLAELIATGLMHTTK